MPPTIFNGGSYSVKAAPYLRTKNGFCKISFEKINVLDLYFIHRYVIIKYSSRSV